MIKQTRSTEAAVRSSAPAALARTPAWLWLLAAAWLISLLLLWPFPTQLEGHALSVGDDLHQAWTIRWIQRALPPGGDPLFAAPTNYPFTMALAINQPIYTSALLGLPLYWLGWSAIGVFNALVLLSFVLACWAMALLGRQLTGSSLAGLIAGVCYAFANVRYAHIVHLNLLSGFWTALLLALLLRLWQRPPATRRGYVALALAVGGVVAAQALGDIYNGLYMLLALVLLALYQLVTRRWGLSLRSTLALGAAMIVTLLLALPVLLPTVRVWADLRLARNFRDHEYYGAHLSDYLVIPRPGPLGYQFGDVDAAQATSSGAEEDSLWPGLLTLTLAGLGLLAARRSERQQQGYFVLLALAAIFLSLGPTIRLNAAEPPIASLPYRWLYDHAPLFASARVPSRWALLAQIGLAALAAYGAAALLRLMPRLGAARRGVALALGLLPVVALLLLTIADVIRTPIRGRTDLVGEPLPQVYRTLGTLPSGALLEWPLENADERLTHGYEYYSIAHGQRLVNSASSIVPQRYIQLRDFLRRFPEAATVTLLRDLGVRYVNVHRYQLSGWGGIAARLAGAPGLRLIGSYDDDSYYLYEVLPEQPALPPPTVELQPDAAGAQLALQLVAPLWLADPADYYAADRPTTVRLRQRDGSAADVQLRLPPALLPGNYRWPVAADDLTLSEVVTVEIGGRSLALLPGPEQLVARRADGPQLVAQPPAATALPGSTLACQAYGKGPIAQRGLVFSVSLLDADWNVVAKQDRYFDEGLPPPHEWPADSFTPVACDLPLPANLPPADYFLALGLWDPAVNAPAPIAGPDGVVAPSIWRIPTPIHVAPQP
jgi:hypothetical protein